MKYKTLLEILSKLTEEQLNQEVQVVNPEYLYENTAVLLPCLGVDTVKNWEFDYARSSYDNKFHGDDLVILADYNPFGADGAVAYEIEGKKNIPIYGKYGKTTKKQQQNPKPNKKKLAKNQIKIVENSIDFLNKSGMKMKPRSKRK